MNKRIAEMALRPKPISLTDEELDFPNHPLTKGHAPIPVKAWVRYPETVVQAEALAVAWNDKAVLLRWNAVDGTEREAWVWASAVERREGSDE